MQILDNIFYAIIFVSVIGSIFTVLSLFVNHVLRCTLPLWFSFCGMMLFCLPVLSSDVFLISPEPQDWLNGFWIATFLCLFIRYADEQNPVWLWNKGVIAVSGLFLWGIIYLRCKKVA